MASATVLVKECISEFIHWYWSLSFRQGSNLNYKVGGSTSLSKTLDLRRSGVVDNVRVCKFGMQIRTGLQIGTARFGCVFYGFRIGDWFGAEVIQKYLEICWIGAFFRSGFYFGEEAWAGWKWMEKQSILLGCIRDSPSKAYCKTRGIASSKF